MAAARAGASSPSPRRSTRPGRSPARVEDAAMLLGVMAGHDPKDSTSADRRCRTSRRAHRRHQRPAHRRAAGVPGRRHAGRDRGAVAAGHRLAEGRGRELGRGFACRTPSTPCRPTTSSRRPRPRRTSPAMTACATACASPGKTLDEMYEQTRAAGFGAEVQAPGADRHLRAVGRLLRRLLSEGAAGAHADPARLRAGVRGVRRAADPGDAERRVRRRRQDRTTRSRCT